MINAIIEINPDRTRKLVNVVIDPKARPNVGLKQNQIVERFNTKEEIEPNLIQWNEGIKLLKKVKSNEVGIVVEIDPTAIDPKKISERGRELINIATSTDDDEDWLNVVRCHNKEQWSEVKYCCATDKLLLRIRLNKIMNELEF